MLNKNRFSKSLIAMILISTIILSSFFTIPVMAAEDTISLDMRNADVRDVLSAFALNMNKNIIFAGEASNIDVNIQDVPYRTALDYILKTIGYDYIEDGKTIIVGDRDTLSNDFYTNIALTKFTLKYVTSDVLNTQIESLGVPVKVVTLDSNKRVIWIQGLHQELSKVNELINMLDRPENAYIEASMPSILLTPITTRYVSAETANDMLRRLGINQGIVLESNPMIIWAYGSSSTVSQIQNIINKIDIPGNASNIAFEISEVRLTYLAEHEIVPIIQQMRINVDVLTFERRLKRVWLAGRRSDINIAKDIISKFDVKEHSSDGLFFVYDTVYITAKELKSRLEALELPGVNINYLNYPEFSRNLIIYCPSDFKVYVMSYINTLDVITKKIKVPVDFSDSDDGKVTLKSRLKLISELTGIPTTRFTISDNVSRDAEKFYFILYVEETPENVKLIKDYITYIDAPLTDGL